MSDDGFALHPRLAADCHLLGLLGGTRLLLHRNAALHWFILVPETTVIDLLDLPRAQRTALMDQAASVAAWLKGEPAYPRVNVGALGLLVPQLHLHVVGRREDDPCWPAPVWGNLAGEAAWEPRSIEALRTALVPGRW